MYIEASNVRANAKARLVSPQVSAGLQCLKFWYNMYGAHVNQLNVYIQSGANLGPPVWTRKGTQGPRWLQGSFVMNYTSDYNVSVITCTCNFYSVECCILVLFFFFLKPLQHLGSFNNPDEEAL